MASNLFKTCRSCLRSFSNLRNLFETFSADGLKLSKCYEVCANLDIDAADELPKMICIMCESNLMTAFYFRKQCIEAVKLFSLNSNMEIRKTPTPPPQPSKDFPLIIKQEINVTSEVETETEEERAMSVTTMDVNKLELQEEVSESTPNIDQVLKLPLEPMHHNAQLNIPVLNESRYFKCTKCQKAFISYRHLEIHVKSHKKDLYVCEICNRNCPSKSVLKIHQKKHQAPVNNKKEAVLNNNKETFEVEYLYGFRPE